MTGDGLTHQLADGVIEIDTRLGGYAERTAGYLLAGPNPVLIETGSQSSVPTLKQALDELGIAEHDLAGIALTHIHLDHAGGVGDIAAAFPNATVYVHELGARHLADPSRLIASAEMVYGDLLDGLYGRLEPTPAERIVVLGDDERVDLGNGRSLQAINSPGHAKHHLGFIDSNSGLLFAGDALGVKLPGGGVLRPATPPADFDLQQAVDSLASFAAHAPTRICLADYGLIDEDPAALLDEAQERLVQWAEAAIEAFEAGEDITAALEARFGNGNDQMNDEARQRVEMLNGIHSNAAGLRRWLETKGVPAQLPGHPHPH